MSGLKRWWELREQAARSKQLRTTVAQLAHSTVPVDREDGTIDVPISSAVGSALEAWEKSAEAIRLAESLENAQAVLEQAQADLDEKLAENADELEAARERLAEAEQRVAQAEADVVAALQAAVEAAGVAEDAKNDALAALNKALEAEGGVSSALAAIQDLGDELGPRITTAQGAADDAAAEAAQAKAEVQQTANELDAAKGDIQTALTGGVSADRLYAGAAAIDVGVIEKLLTDTAFLRLLYAHKIIVDAQDFAPKGPANENAWSSIRAGFVTNTAQWGPNRAIALNQTLGSDSQMRGPRLPVTPGEALYCAANLGWTGSSSTSSVQLRFEWYDSPDGARTGQTTVVSSSAATGFIEGTITVPEGVTYANFYIFSPAFAENSNRRVRTYEARKQVGAVQIADGAVTAPHITASESLSAKIAEFLTVKASTIIGDNAALNLAFIQQLVGDSAFLRLLYANRIIVSPEDLTPGPGGAEDVYELGAQASIYNNGNDPTGRAIRILGGGTVADRSVYGPRVRVTPGDRIRVAYTAARYNASSTLSWQVRIYWWDRDGNAGPASTLCSAGTEPAAAAQAREVFVTVPDGAVYASVRFYAYAGEGSYVFRNLDVRSQVGAVQIADGAITADKAALGFLQALEATMEQAWVRSASIINLDVEKLRVTGTSNLDTAVAEEIWAKIATLQQLRVTMDTVLNDLIVAGALDFRKAVGLELEAAEINGGVVRGALFELLTGHADRYLRIFQDGETPVIESVGLSQNGHRQTARLANGDLTFREAGSIYAAEYNQYGAASEAVLSLRGAHGVVLDGGSTGVRVEGPLRTMEHEGPHVLWEGTPVSVTNTQQINLSASVLSQLTGIILEWSAADGTTVHDDQWNYTHIPKAAVSRNGVRVGLWNGNQSMQKWISVSNSSLTGVASNGTAPQSSMRLRRVLGY